MQSILAKLSTRAQAHSATEQVESDAIRELGIWTVLSPQQPVSCDRIDDGCRGGDPSNTYQYIRQARGLAYESAYPYISGQTQSSGRCDESKASYPVISVESYRQVSGEAQMAEYVGSTGASVDSSPWKP
jgi:hypothetical protein